MNEPIRSLTPSPILLAGAVGIGGAAGALARWGATVLALGTIGGRYPWGTLFVNLAGCLLIGVLKGWLDRVEGLHPAVSLAAVTGFLGALTTFSTFAFETQVLWSEGQERRALVYLVTSVAGGLALVWLGLLLGRRIGV